MSAEKQTTAKQAAGRDDFPRPWWRRKWIYILVVIVVYGGWYIWPIVNKNSEQDSCNFGAISNKDYRIILSKALNNANDKKGELSTAIRALENLKASKIIQSQIDKLVESRSDAEIAKSQDYKIAVMHAVIRANGGEYRKTYPDHKDPFQYLSKKSWNKITYVYIINSNKYFLIRPALYEIPINVRLDISNDGEARVFVVDYRVWENVKGGPKRMARSTYNPTCPPVPYK